MPMRVGHTLQWVASEVGVSPHTIRSWIAKGLLRNGPRERSHEGYSYEFVDQCLIIHEWLQLYPRGPLENLRDIIEYNGHEYVRKILTGMYPEPDEEEVA